MELIFKTVFSFTDLFNFSYVTNVWTCLYFIPFNSYFSFIVVLKILMICVFAIATRGTVPRYRLDQLTQLNWKIFIFAWISFFTVSVFFYIVWL